MGVLCTAVDLQFAQHGVAQRAFRQHAFHRILQHAVGMALLQLGEIGFVDTARITCVAIVLFILRPCCRSRAACRR